MEYRNLKLESWDNGARERNRVRILHRLQCIPSDCFPEFLPNLYRFLCELQFALLLERRMGTDALNKDVLKCWSKFFSRHHFLYTHTHMYIYIYRISIDILRCIMLPHELRSTQKRLTTNSRLRDQRCFLALQNDKSCILLLLSWFYASLIPDSISATINVRERIVAG